jgi:inner membrane protein
MPSSFSHAVAAIALGKAYAKRPLPLRFWLLSIGCSLAPDADVVCQRFGIKYTDMLGHRGLTHSFLFAACLSAVIVLLAFRKPIQGTGRLSLFFLFFTATISHAVLDAMVDGTLGVAFFAPFSSTRYFLPWRPIVSSPIGLAFFSSAGATVIMNEFLWIWIPALMVILTPWLRRRFSNGTGPARSETPSLDASE